MSRISASILSQNFNKQNQNHVYCNVIVSEEVSQY